MEIMIWRVAWGAKETSSASIDQHSGALRLPKGEDGPEAWATAADSVHSIILLAASIGGFSPSHWQVVNRVGTTR